MRRLFQHSICHGDAFEERARPFDSLAQCLLLLPVGSGKALRILLISDAPLHHLDAILRLALTRHRHRKGEAVEQLRAYVALFGIHRAHEHEACRMRIGNALALHRIDAHRR